MNGKFTFSKKEKLCHKKHIDILFNDGKTFNVSPLKVFYIIPGISENLHARVVIAVSRKKFKRAVDRNRLRRIIREAYRLNREGIDNLTRFVHLGFVYTGNSAEVSFTEIENSMKRCILKLVKAVNGETQD